jgi:HlyD family secretion protein
VHLGDTAIIDVDAYSNQNKEFKGVVTLIANTAKDKASTDAITEFEVRILILRSSYDDLVKAGNKFPFRPGMTASVDVLTSRKANVLSVPLAAVTTRGEDDKDGDKDKDKEKKEQQNNPALKGNTTKPKKKEDKVVVFVNENGVAKMKEVKTGISDYDNIEILSGISDSTEVVTGPFLVISKRLKEDQKIKKAEKKEEKKENDSK